MTYHVCSERSYKQLNSPKPFLSRNKNCLSVSRQHSLLVLSSNAKNENKNKTSDKYWKTLTSGKKKTVRCLTNWSYYQSTIPRRIEWCTIVTGCWGRQHDTPSVAHALAAVAHCLVLHVFRLFRNFNQPLHYNWRVWNSYTILTFMKLGVKFSKQ